MLNAEVRASIERSVLCWLATVGEDGMPNVSPKEVFTAVDDTHVRIAHIASPNSVRNIRAHPQVCVSFVDVFVQKGFKLNGNATVIDKSDANFTEKAQPLKALVPDIFPIHAVLEIEVTRVTPIVAPSYRLFADTTEEGQIAGALRRYGRALGRPIGFLP